MSDVGCLSFAALVRLLTSAIRLLQARLLQQIVIEFNYSIAKCEAFCLNSLCKVTHGELRAKNYEVRRKRLTFLAFVHLGRKNTVYYNKVLLNMVNINPATIM